MSVTTNSVVFRLLLALMVLAPLPLGSNRPWAWSLLALLTGLLSAAWAVLVIQGKCRAPIAPSRLSLAILFFGSVLLWAELQTSAMTPSAWWHPLWIESAGVLGRGASAGRISVDPALTQVAILRLSCYGAIFWLAAQLGRERARAREGLVVVALTSVCYAVYGIIVYFAGWEQILWLKKWAYLGDLTATFVNRNAYGAYAGLGLICCVALFVEALRPRRSEPHRRVSELAETILVRGLPYLVAALVLATALLLSHSRGAFVCTAIALSVLMIILVASRVLLPRLALLLCLAILIVGGATLVMSGDVTVQRLSETGQAETDDGRANAYRLTAEAISDTPWTGHGLGAFQPAFQPYRDASLAGFEEWEYAHNVHLEMAMDLGLPATVTLYACFSLIILGCLRGLRVRRRDHIYPATAISVFILLISHGVVDFSVQMPAIASTFSFLLGLGYAQSWSSSSRNTDRPRLAISAPEARAL